MRFRRTFFTEDLEEGNMITERPSIDDTIEHSNAQTVVARPSEYDQSMDSRFIGCPCNSWCSNNDPVWRSPWNWSRLNASTLSVPKKLSDGRLRIFSIMKKESDSDSGVLMVTFKNAVFGTVASITRSQVKMAAISGCVRFTVFVPESANLQLFCLKWTRNRKASGTRPQSVWSGWIWFKQCHLDYFALSGLNDRH
jgi:hypothetical protein